MLPGKPARKIVFDDDVENDAAAADESTAPVQGEDDEMADVADDADSEGDAEDSSDDDEAPEAVGVTEVKEQLAAARAEEIA